jgi:2-dehydro-3-deoxygluconokinase
VTVLSTDTSKDAGLDLVSAGESMVMFVPDPPMAFSDASQYRPTVAGAESNVAAFAAALGLRTAWISRVGADAFGDYMTAHLSELGVVVASVERDRVRPTGVAFKELTHDGRTGVAYYRRGSAASMIDENVAAKVRSMRSRMLHLSGITPALSDSCLAFVESLVAERPPGTLLSFDVNWRPSLWSDNDPGVLHRIAQAADIVFVGGDEAHELWGVSSPREVRRLLPAPSVLVVKQGPVGATAFTTDAELFVPSLEVDVVEPVGAGDAFAAGFLVGTRRGLPLKSRLRLGVIVAASALSVSSDVGPLPSAQTIEAMLGLDDEEWASATFQAAVGH